MSMYQKHMSADKHSHPAHGHFLLCLSSCRALLLLGRNLFRSGARVGWAALLMLLLATTGHAGTAPAHSPDAGWAPLIERLAADGFSREHVESLFARLGKSYSSAPMGHKIRAMYNRKFAPPKAAASSRSKASKTPPIYPGVLVPANLKRARTFLERYHYSLARMEKRFGVPREIAVGLMLVETRLGSYLGKEHAFLNLASLAASDSLDKLRPELAGLKLTAKRKTWACKRIESKSSWAYAELKALITYCDSNELDPVSMPGSIYGAVGICQFMPSNILRFGVDGNGDGKVNLFHVQDAVHSLANYLKFHGWKSGLPRTSQNKVLRHYNNSRTYANTILAVADALR